MCINFQSKFTNAKQGEASIDTLMSRITPPRCESAIYCTHTQVGSLFGPYGPDILISDEANKNELSCSNLGKVFERPNGYQNYQFVSLALSKHSHF